MQTRASAGVFRSGPERGLFTIAPLVVVALQVVEGGEVVGLVDEVAQLVLQGPGLGGQGAGGSNTAARNMTFSWTDPLNALLPTDASRSSCNFSPHESE